MKRVQNKKAWVTNRQKGGAAYKGSHARKMGRIAASINERSN